MHEQHMQEQHIKDQHLHEQHMKDQHMQEQRLHQEHMHRQNRFKQHRLRRRADRAIKRNPPWREYNLTIVVLVLVVISMSIGVIEIKITDTISFLLLPLIYSLIMGLALYLLKPFKYIDDEYEYLKKNQIPVTDEYIRPAYNILFKNKSIINEGDVIFHINLRADRAIEMSSILSNVNMQKQTLPNSKNLNAKFYSLLFYADSVNGEVVYERNALDNIF